MYGMVAWHVYTGMYGILAGMNVKWNLVHVVGSWDEGDDWVSSGQLEAIYHRQAGNVTS